MSQPDRQEIEAKFEIRNPMLAAYWASAASLTAAFGLGALTTVTHIDTYLDSASYQLLRAGYSLRLRHTEHGFIITLKTLATTADSPIHTRLELEGPIADASEPLNMDGWPKPVRQQVQNLLDKAPALHPLCILHQRRQKRTVSTKARSETPAQVVAELSIDEVTLYPPAGDWVKLATLGSLDSIQALAAFWEIEVELKPGQDVATLEVLTARVARDSGVAPNRSSKFERAMAIVNLQASHGEPQAIERI